MEQRIRLRERMPRLERPPIHSEPDEAPAEHEALKAGRYQLHERLGSGSQAETFAGVDGSTGQPVAIKRFHVRGANSWKDVELAEREAQVLSCLVHPNLPRYVDHFEQDGDLYLVMERIEGESLNEWLKRRQPLGLSELLALANTLSEILDYLHGRLPPVIHRDIKPGNLIRRKNGSFVLVDFGSVRQGLYPADGSTVVGTFGYMAPEQFQGRAVPASDVYAVGASLVALAAGVSADRLPHRGLEIDVQQALGGGAPVPFIELLKELVRIDPDQRPTRLAPVLTRMVQAPANPRPDPFRGPSEAESAGRRSAESQRMVKSMTGPPVPLLILLTVARVVLFALLEVAVPLVLVLLSPVFGPSLRKSATQAAAAGRAARARLAMMNDKLAGSEPWVMEGRSKRQRHARGSRHGFAPTPDHPRARSHRKHRG